MSCAWESSYDGQQQSKAMLNISAAGAVKEAVNPLMAKIVAMDEKVEKLHNFMLRGPESVFKDIATFAKEMFKCPICLAPPKDEIPYAVSCWNHMFWVDQQRETKIQVKIFQTVPGIIQNSVQYQYPIS